MTNYDFVVVGAGSAGRTAVETLVEEQPGASILLVDRESALPYKRTKVSKNVAAGFGPDAFAVHDRDWYEDAGVILKTGEDVLQMDPLKRTFQIGEETYAFSKLLIAAGAVPVLPFREIPRNRWSALWTVEDAVNLGTISDSSQSVAVIGNGVLGVEASWQLVTMGRTVSLVGRSELPMRQYLDEQCASELAGVLEQGGVVLEPGRDVRDVKQRGGTLELIADGAAFPVDYIVVTAGSVPDIRLAEEAGIPVDRGILVDEALRTGLDGIWAAGDCAQHPDGSVTGLWHSAENQGRLAALSMLDRDVRNTNPPYRLKCEVFGGYWFSAGPVNAPETVEFPAAEEWRFGRILWKPRFLNGRLKALSASAPGGMDKNSARSAQNLLFDAADSGECRRILSMI